MPEEFDRNRTPGIPAAPGPQPPPPVPILRLGSVDSTNRHAERLLEAGSLQGPAMIVAGEQTAGEGRRGAPWSSPAGGLWATLAWPLEDDAGPPNGLGLRLGVACLRTVRSAAPEARLKWPNDVLVGGRKVCGCMARVVAGPHGDRWILAAAGINANNDVDPALVARAGSLREATRAEVDLEALEARLLEELRWALTTTGIDGATLEEASAALVGVGEIIRLRDGRKLVSGTLLGLGAGGTPRVRTSDGRVVETSPGVETLRDA